MAGDMMNDESARFVNEDGRVTTFARLMFNRKGGADIEKIEDPETGLVSYRVEDKNVSIIESRVRAGSTRE